MFLKVKLNNENENIKYIIGGFYNKEVIKLCLVSIYYFKYEYLSMWFYLKEIKFEENNVILKISIYVGRYLRERFGVDVE